jgi:hypothetical protein
MKAFSNFKNIEALADLEQQQKAWLNDYEGLIYSRARNEKHFDKWASEPKIYDPSKFTTLINTVGRRADRLIIEFDAVEGEPENPKKSLEIVRQKLIDNNWGFIRSTHGSKNSDYLWVEFDRDLTEEESKRFMAWICPEGSKIDINFTSFNKVFPVLYAIHWKHSHARETPIEYHEAEKINFDSLKLPKEKLKTTTTTKKGYSYQTYTKKEESYSLEPTPEALEILTRPNLFNEITINEFNKKVVGEELSRKVIFLCASGGRLVKNCQIASYNILVNDDAGTGKDYITGKVLEMIPKEFYVHKTRISPTVFTYWHNAEKEPDWTWDGKVFYPEDISEVVLNSDVFKVMCSSGSTATIVVRQQAVDLEIKGKPVMITTTATATPNPELVRRFVILNLDSSEKQTEAIMKRHSQYAKEGIIPEYNSKYKEAMAYLKRVNVSIPFADIIDQYFPKNSVVMRTHYPRYLDYIRAAAAFHQYQRQEKEGVILAEGQDYDIARECFLKLTSNKYMIPLTINQKKILEVFERGPNLKGNIGELHANQLNFLSEPALKTNLGLLVKYGILQTFSELDSYNRTREVFSMDGSYKPNEKINLPTYEELCRNTLSSLEPLSSLSTLEPLSSTKKGQKEGDDKDDKDSKALFDSNNLNFDGVADG